VRAVARVLLVEDTEEIRSIVEFWMARSGHEVDAAGDGAAALELAHAQPPDVAICDLGLPDMDGLNLCRELRSFLDIPILILSASVDTKTRAIIRETDATDFMAKPFNGRELASAVATLLGESD
jgi:DNA-binding response OmpR family regulator